MTENANPCDDCGDSVAEALARTVRLSVDRSQIDAQRLCPECFADWIDRYDDEMRPDGQETTGEDSEIIVD